LSSSDRAPVYPFLTLRVLRELLFKIPGFDFGFPVRSESARSPPRTASQGLVELFRLFHDLIVDTRSLSLLALPSTARRSAIENGDSSGGAIHLHLREPGRMLSPAKLTEGMSAPRGSASGGLSPAKLTEGMSASGGSASGGRPCPALRRGPMEAGLRIWDSEFRFSLARGAPSKGCVSSADPKLCEKCGPRMKETQPDLDAHEPSLLHRWYWLTFAIGAVGLFGGAALSFSTRPRARGRRQGGVPGVQRKLRGKKLSR
jgi:hypothetical protein